MEEVPGQFLRPKNIEEAGELVAKLGEKAGILWVGTRVDQPETWARRTMIDLTELGLTGIQVGRQGVVIGAMTRIQSLVESEDIRLAYGGLLHAAARRLAHYGLRNLATVGGALANRQGSPELILALLALDAEVVVVSPQEHVVPISDGWLDAGSGPTAGLVTELRIPHASEAAGWGLEWLGRSPMDQALAAACVGLELDGGKVRRPRVAVAGSGWPAGRIASAEAALDGHLPEDWNEDDLFEAVAAAVTPEDKIGASADYQREAMARLAARAAAVAFKKAGK